MKLNDKIVMKLISVLGLISIPFNTAEPNNGKKVSSDISAALEEIQSFRLSCLLYTCTTTSTHNGSFFVFFFPSYLHIPKDER